ncbi:hypothetical protein [Spirosoma pulveris]
MEPRTETPEGTYIHLVGPATIHVIDGQIHLFLLDKNRQPIDISNPIKLGGEVSFVNMHMVVEFSQQQLTTHKGLLSLQKNTFVEFPLVKTPESSIALDGSNFKECMTSTDPPKCNNTVIG